MLKRYFHEREGTCAETSACIAFGGLGQVDGAETITCAAFRGLSNARVPKPPPVSRLVTSECKTALRAYARLCFVN